MKSILRLTCVLAAIAFGHLPLFAGLFPQAVKPVLEYVYNNPDGTYTALYGYQNDNATVVSIPVGSGNKFTPLTQSRGQPTTFQPGRQVGVFTVVFSSGNQVWTLDSRTSTASPNMRPVATLTAPVNNSTYQAPAAFTLTATATDTDGTVQRVEFYQNGVKIGQATTAPYTLAISSLAVGTYKFTARAIDNRNAPSLDSAIVNVTVNSAQINQPPSVALTAPANNSVFIAPASFTLTATASDSDGTIAKVDFYQGTSLLGTATTAPYQFTWTNVVSGTYNLTAKAYDNANAMTPSALVSIFVDAPPVVAMTAPAAGAFLQPSTPVTLVANATDSDNAVAKVEFFNGTNKLGESITPSTAPSTYSFIVAAGLASGSHLIHAVATDVSGATGTSPDRALSVNFPPVANAQSLTTNEDVPLTFNLSGSDIEGSALAASIVTQPTHGTIALTAAPFTYKYTPAANYFGPDSFTFKVNDGALDSAPAVISISVTPMNDPPVAYPQSVSVPEDGSVQITLGASDGDSPSLFFIKMTDVSNGTLTPTATPNIFNYTPAANYYGPDSFTFAVSDGDLFSAPATVAITVTSTNDAPVTSNLTLETFANAPSNFTLSGTDIDGDALTYAIITGPAHGTLTLNPQPSALNSYTYTPATDYVGPVSATFTVSDSIAPPVPGNLTITVKNRTPIANNGSVAVVASTQSQITLSASDPDGQPLTYTIVTPPTNGSLVPTSSPTIYNYTPNANIDQTDSFTFKANDGYADSNVASVAITAKSDYTPPVVNAGPDSTLTLPAYAMLNGLATEGKGGPLVLKWTKIDGPGTVEFENASVAVTRALISAPGSYTLRLSATDSRSTVSDDVRITVNASNLVSRTYTTTADFAEGIRTQLNSDTPDQLQLNEESSAGRYLWVAVSSKGTIVKINTRTGKVEGEYWTSPNGQPKNPSRTTVDLNGAVWCTNRDGNSVVQVGSVESGMWIDKNGNGQPDTSVGLNDIRAWTNAGAADTNGGITTAADECLINYVRVSSSGTRHICVDKKNNIWVSGTGNRIFDRIDSKTGKIIRTEGPVGGAGGYGGIIDRNGVIWSASWGSVLRWDTAKPLSGPAGDNWSLVAGSSQYGLALGPDGYVYASTLGGGVVYKYAPDGTLVGTYNQGYGNAQGLTVDRRGHIWVAHSILGSSTVGHIAPNGTWLGNVTVGSGPTGVAVDADGKIWATNYNDGTVSRIDPSAGPMGVDGVTPVGAVDFTSAPLGGNPYNYSDMTGSTLTAPPLTGVWTTVYDSGKTDAPWGSINWHALIYDDSKITLTVCSSTDNVTFSPWRVGVRGQDLDVPNGRYLKINVLLQRSTSGHSPILYDVTVGESGFLPDYPFNKAPVIEAPPRQAASYGVDITLDAKVGDDGLPYLSKLTYQWEKVSGPGTVIFDDPKCVAPAATFSVTGNYVLRLTTSDGEFTTSADINVIANLPPIANAGPDLVIRDVGGSINLQGSAYDDGASLSGLVTTWSQLQGPAAATIADPTSPTSTVTLPAAGRYFFELKVSDGWAVSSDIMEVRVGPALPALLPRDPAAWWPFDLNYADVVNGHVAVPTGVPRGTGYVAAGLFFSGASSSMARAAAKADLAVGSLPASAGATLEFWMNMTDRNTDRSILAWVGGPSVWMDYYSTQLNINWAKTGGGSSMGSGSLIYENSWHHCVMTYEKASGMSRLYVNGILRNQQNIGAFELPTTGDFLIGSLGTTYPTFKGQLDEVTLYDRALTPVEIGAIYQSGVAGKAPAGTNTAPIVKTGPDVSIRAITDTANLTAVVSDDGQPIDAGVNWRWSKLSGPGDVVFGAGSGSLPTSPLTTAVFSAPGIYMIKLDADDASCVSSDTMVVRVGQSYSNQLPGDAKAWWQGNSTSVEYYTRQIAMGWNLPDFVDGKVA